MDNALLKAELDNDPALDPQGQPQPMGYAAAGWLDPLPTLTGDPPNGIPYTDADNVARFVQAEKYQAIADLMNDATKRPLAAKDVTAAHVAKALDKAEWKALTPEDREFVKMLRQAGDDRWKKELAAILPVAGATRNALGLLKQSRFAELGQALARKSTRVKAGHIKRVRGDTQ